MNEVYIGLGSNKGNPKINLKNGLENLSKLPGYSQKKISSLYVTAPVGPIKQSSFFNIVVCGYYEGLPDELLKCLLDIEKKQGRVRDTKWGPRTLDMDILIFGNLTLSEARLEIPHPELRYRVFVLIPLLELSPELLIPFWDKTPLQLYKKINARERKLQTIKKIKW